MNAPVYVKAYADLPFNDGEILRYAGVKRPDERTLALLDEVKQEAKPVYKVCYLILPVQTAETACDLGLFSVSSAKLAKNLAGCKEAALFAATTGVEIDRLIARYGKLSPVKALLFQALGAERIETLCNAFCKDIEREYGGYARPRFSPGYGDLPLETQRQIFRVLDCERKIGLTLTDSLLMSPTKSVTAFMGLGEKKDGKRDRQVRNLREKGLRPEV